MIRDLVVGNRSYRRFDESHAIDRATLEEFVDLARLSASGGNLQPLKYILSCDPEENATIFPNLVWAGYLKDWDGPAEDERPTGYVVFLCDTDIAASPGCDHGIAVQTMLLAAREKGLGGCIFGSIKRDALRKALSIPDRLEIVIVLALGKPVEQIRIEQIAGDGSVKYWRSPDGVHHVPKRALADIILSEA